MGAGVPSGPRETISWRGVGATISWTADKAQTCSTAGLELTTNVLQVKPSSTASEETPTPPAAWPFRCAYYRAPLRRLQRLHGTRMLSGVFDPPLLKGTKRSK
jgi:hypothetical protein